LPQGSHVSLNGVSTNPAAVLCTPDVAGTYVVRLQMNNTQQQTDTAWIAVTHRTAGELQDADPAHLHDDQLCVLSHWFGNDRTPSE
jgi:hypothetical protein